MRLDGRCALVTGAGGGLGAVYAHELARRGAAVVAVDLDDARAEQTARTISDDGLACSHVAADLTDQAQVEGALRMTLDRHGRLDILVNNAGGDPNPGLLVDGTVDLAHWQLIFDINLKTALLCCQAAAAPMKQQRYGRIVNVSSRAARSTGWFAEVAPEYAAAKLAVISLTRHFAKQLGPYGITVNCMVPSFTISGPALQGSWDRMTEEEQGNMLAQTPLRRLPEPQELANVVGFLASDASSYVTGVALDVNGGSFMS